MNDFLQNMKVIYWKILIYGRRRAETEQLDITFIWPFGRPPNGAFFQVRPPRNKNKVNKN